MRSGQNFLDAGIYASNGAFASYKFFFRFVGPHFKNVKYSKTETLKKLKQLKKKFSTVKGKVDQKKAQELLVAKDIDKIIKALEKIKLKTPETIIKEHYKKYINLLKKHKLTKWIAPYFIVKVLPKPYDKMSWSAAYFNELEERYNIKSGIYFLKKNLYEFEVSKSLIHELIHTCICSNTDDDFNMDSRGLEEGICDVGVLYFGSKLLSKRIAKNLILYGKFRYSPKPEFVAQYREGIRMALVLYNKFGMNGLFDLIRKGRRELIKVEKLAMQGKFDKIKLKKGLFTKDMDQLSAELLTYQRYLVVSPLAYFIATKVRRNSKLNKIIDQYNLEPRQARKALKELQERVFIVTSDKGVVSSDSSKRYLQANTLKYEIKL